MPNAAITASNETPLDVATDAYIWGFPRMLYAKYLRDFKKASAPFNRFIAMSRMATPDHGGVNVDTLYGVAWLDVGAEPVVLSVPDAQDRYYSIQMIDVHANNFAYVGRRTTGTSSQQFLIAGPEWAGTIPPHMSLIRSPSRCFFCFLRTLIDGEADIAAANRFQAEIKVAPLSAFPTGLLGTLLIDNLAPFFPHAHNHLDRLGARFFDILGDALASDPPTRAADVAALHRFAAIGVGAGRHPTTEHAAMAGVFANAAQQAYEKIFAATASTVRNGWSANWRVDEGSKDPLFKAGINRKGIGILSVEECLYLLPAAKSLQDGDEVPAWSATGPDGRPLSGNNRYCLRFAAGQLPPVDAFWSLTLYQPNLSLFRNPIARYALGDRTPALAYAADGSLELLIQHARPTATNTNWLPAPEGEFNLFFRAYQPRANFLDGSYQLPPLEIVNK